MKKLSIIIFSICTLVLARTASAQNKLPDLSVGKIANIGSYLSKLYHPDTSFINHVCINTIVYVKFKVNDDKIDSIGFSANCPVAIKEALKKAMLATETYFNSTAKEKNQLKDKTFLLPVIFYYQLGCSSSQIVQKEPVSPKDATNELMKYISRDDLLHKSLESMLKFDDGKSYVSLDCTLITPITFLAYD